MQFYTKIKDTSGKVLCIIKGNHSPAKTMQLAFKRLGHLAGTQLEGCILSKAVFTGCSFQNANLDGVCLQGATLVNCDFSGAWMQNADLRGANITGCIFDDAYLHGLHCQGSGLFQFNGFLSESITIDMTNERIYSPAWYGSFQDWKNKGKVYFPNSESFILSVFNNAKPVCFTSKLLNG